MDQTWLLAISLPAIFSFLFFILSKINFKRGAINQLPGPPSLPIIGHLHILQQPLHRTFQKLSSRYGPIYSLRFGYRPVVVVSSSSLVEECLTKNDVVLANRPRLLVGQHLNYDWTTLGHVSYGPLWRNLRRLTTLEILSTTKINMLTGIRYEETKSLIKELFGSGKKDGFVEVEMRSKFLDLSYNIIMRMVTGKRYFGVDMDGVDEAKEFREIVREYFELTGMPIPTDYVPILKWVDLQNMEGKMLAVRKKMDAFLKGLIDECRRNRSQSDGSLNGGNNMTPMIYNLLDLQESDPENYSDQIINGIIVIMLLAGTDTSAVTMEWALSLLLNHPDVLHKAREEIDNYVGHGRLVDESDLPKLRWIQNIVNETLRLFPAAPLLVPHESSEDCTIGGYVVEKGTMVFINAWAVHRDPSIWEDPLSFKPERFERVKSDECRFSLIPFGQGRRSCPGASLANRVVALALATLIQCFDWEKVGEEKVDLAEGFGLTMPKVKPLEAMCRANTYMIDVLSKI